MKHLRPAFLSEYNRWKNRIGPTEPYTGENILGIHDVLRAHFLMADYFHTADDPIGMLGPRDSGATLLHSALARQLVSFGGKQKWSRNVEFIATLYFGLVKNHPFMDGNKRTALLSLIYHMSLCGLIPTIGQIELERLTVAVASNRLSEYSGFKETSRRWGGDAEPVFLAQFLRRYTRQVDKRCYTITYKDLSTLLDHRGFWLDNANGNQIDVMTNKLKLVMGIPPKRILRPVRLVRIGFPGWCKQVSRSVIKTVREATGLTEPHGVDSQSFFHGLDDLQTLIQLYDAPLRRLKDR